MARGKAIVGTDHVTGCRRCQALLRLLKNTAVEVDHVAEGDRVRVAETRARIPERHGPHEPVFGEVLAVRAGHVKGELLICVLLAWASDNGTLEVAPVTTDIHEAAEWDLLVPPAAGPLGYPVAIEVWNHGAVPSEHVVERYGALNEGVRQALHRAYEAIYVGEPPSDIAVGPAIASDDDPRMVFQASEAERARAYWAFGDESSDEVETADVAARDAPEAAGKLEVPTSATEPEMVTLGVRLAAWLEETGWDREDLARETGWSSDNVERVLEDGFDPKLIQFEPALFAEFLRFTEVDEFEAADLVAASINPAWFPEAPEEQLHEETVYRRTSGLTRRLGAGRRPEPGDQEATASQRAELRRWAAEVASALSERRAR